MIPAMWYMASQRAASRQETRMLPSTRRTIFTVEDSRTKATRRTVLAAITGSTTASSITTLKTRKPGPLKGDSVLLPIEFLSMYIGVVRVIKRDVAWVVYGPGVLRSVLRSAVSSPLYLSSALRTFQLKTTEECCHANQNVSY